MATAAASGAGDSLVPRVEFILSARNLADMDVFGKSDTFAVVFKVEAAESEVGRTAVMENNLNPDWTHQFVQDYFFEETQPYRVRVYDEDKKSSSNLRDQDFIGECQFTLGELMGKQGQSIKLDLMKNDRKKGELFVVGEEISDAADYAQINLKGKGLTNKDGFFGKSDPFFELFRANESGGYNKIFDSPVVQNDLNPDWPTVSINIQRLCNNDLSRPIKLIIRDFDDDGKHEYMGECETSLMFMMEHAGSELNVRDKEKNKDAGKIKIESVGVIRIPTMLDYVKGGCEMSLTVAIDFTGSNGNPSSPSSLHYIDPSGHQLNEYQQAILSIGKIVQEYDSDKRFPVYGFGGKIQGSVSHCFHLGANGEEEVAGIDGIMNAYRNSFGTGMTLSGPTVMHQVIRRAMDKASQASSQQQQKYNILLVLCDGVINDMDQTIDAIVEAGTLPLSIIIVGIGGEDFESMRTLDADDRKLTSPATGKEARRDLVQFVPFRSFAAGQVSRLARDVLHEIPAQFSSYMKLRGFTPNPPRPPSVSGGPHIVHAAQAAGRGHK